MCIDTDMCVSSVQDYLICPICCCIFCLDSVVDKEGHIFCKKCIMGWLSNDTNNTCPNDRKKINREDLRPIPFPLLEIINNLKFRCAYTKYGCIEEIKLENLKTHELNCKYKDGNPNASAPPLEVVTVKPITNLKLRKEAINKSLNPYISLKLNNSAKNHIVTSLDEIRRLNGITSKFLNRSLRLDEIAADFLTLNSPDEDLLKDILTGNKAQLLTCKLPAISGSM